MGDFNIGRLRFSYTVYGESFWFGFSAYASRRAWILEFHLVLLRIGISWCRRIETERTQ
jgi:hypothetical protein